MSTRRSLSSVAFEERSRALFQESVDELDMRTALAAHSGASTPHSRRPAPTGVADLVFARAGCGRRQPV